MKAIVARILHDRCNPVLDETEPYLLGGPRKLIAVLVRSVTARNDIAPEHPCHLEDQGFGDALPAEFIEPLRLRRDEERFLRILGKRTNAEFEVPFVVPRQYRRARHPNFPPCVDVKTTVLVYAAVKALGHAFRV